MVKTRSKFNRVELIDDQLYVQVKSAPIQGKANAEIIRLLSKRLKLPKSSISIIRGHTGNSKVLDLDLSGEELKARLQQAQRKQ